MLAKFVTSCVGGHSGTLDQCPGTVKSIVETLRNAGFSPAENVFYDLGVLRFVEICARDGDWTNVVTALNPMGEAEDLRFSIRWLSLKGNAQMQCQKQVFFATVRSLMEAPDGLAEFQSMVEAFSGVADPKSFDLDSAL